MARLRLKLGEHRLNFDLVSLINVWKPYGILAPGQKIKDLIFSHREIEYRVGYMNGNERRRHDEWIAGKPYLTGQNWLGIIA